MINLPDIAQLSFPASNLQSQQTTQQRIYTIYDWDFSVGDFKLSNGKLVELTGLDYLQVWIQKALLTEQGTLLYTGSSYGSESNSLIGTDFDPNYTKSEYMRMISDALLQNDAITSVDGFTFSQAGSFLTIGFTVSSIYGTTSGQVII